MASPLLTLDGCIGEGGGHVLRAAVALSAATGRAFRIDNVRAKRLKPGLLRSHLAAVRAAAAVCGGNVEGDVVGSRQLTFRPGEARAGEYRFAVGAGGSAALVLQTVLPALLRARGPSTVSVDGATHGPDSPVFEFVQKAWAGAIARSGAKVDVALERHGFCLAGGGRIVARVEPAASLLAVHLRERGTVRHRLCKAMVAALPGEIAVRELELVRRMMDWPEECFQIRQIPEDEGIGNVVVVEVGDDVGTEVFAAHGTRGVRAEAVAEYALQQAKQYLAANVPVGRHLAEQLIAPLAVLAGGSFVTTSLSRDATATIELAKSFVDVPVDVRELSKHRWLVSVGPMSREATAE